VPVLRTDLLSLEKVTIGKQNFIFVDGGITPYNNPFSAFLMATVEPYNLNWSAGEQHASGVSWYRHNSPAMKTSNHQICINYSKLVLPLALATQNEQDLCRVFGKCLVGDPLDREVGDLVEKKGPVNPKFLPICAIMLN